MARKINKKSRRGAINKRTIRRNKSRVGGVLDPPSLFPPSNPKFKFNFNKKMYVIEKKRGLFSAQSTYSIYVDGEIPVSVNENIECDKIIQNLDILTKDNHWLIYALYELIENYFTQTHHDKGSGRIPKKFEHFNELLVEMIQYFTNNYITFISDTKWKETALQIELILTKTDWCEATNNFGFVTLKSCGSKPIQLDSSNLTPMFNHFKSKAKAD